MGAFQGRYLLARFVSSHAIKHILEAPVPPSERLGKPLPADLEAIVLGCLAKDRNDRPASAAVLRTSVLACADAGRNEQPAARAWWLAHRASRKNSPSPVDPVDDAGSRPATLAIDLGHRGMAPARSSRHPLVFP